MRLSTLYTTTSLYKPQNNHRGKLILYLYNRLSSGDCVRDGNNNSKKKCLFFIVLKEIDDVCPFFESSANKDFFLRHLYSSMQRSCVLVHGLEFFTDPGSVIHVMT